MSRFLFMGEQEDPEMDTWLGRGVIRVYDGTRWDEIRCPRCAAWLPCPPKGLIPLHPTGTGKPCPGGNTFPENPEWRTP